LHSPSLCGILLAVLKWRRLTCQQSTKQCHPWYNYVPSTVYWIHWLYKLNELSRLSVLNIVRREFHNMGMNSENVKSLRSIHISNLLKFAIIYRIRRILNNRQKQWVASSTLRNRVEIVDSLFNGKLSAAITNQLCQIYGCLAMDEILDVFAYTMPKQWH